MKKGVIGFFAVAFLLCTILPVYGEEGEGESETTYLMETTGSPYPPEPAPLPSGEAMIMDFILVRPISIIALAFGASISVLATPLTLASGTTGPVYQKLVVEPYNFLICRPLGQF